MFKNDERYWNINLLNKWFAISSVIFLVCTIWIFVDDNDDEFKEYQREFRKMQIQVAQEKLEQQAEDVKVEKEAYESALAAAKVEFDSRSVELNNLQNQLSDLQDIHYDQNMKFQSHKANVEALKYLVESDNAHSNHGPSSRDEYYAALDKLDVLRLAREDTEIEMGMLETQIKEIKSIVKEKQDALDKYTKQYTLTSNKLGKLDRSRMTMANKLGDIVRDLPILDFLDPYYKVNQIVVADVKYDVNFAAVPVVDSDNRLLGIVTVDDVVDVIREEATEDFFRMAGAGKDREILLKSSWENAKVRLPWLFASWVGGVVAASVIGAYEHMLESIVALAAFIPVIIGMGGNIGTQSSTIIVRGMATGRIEVGSELLVLVKELKVGLILGILYGILLGIFANLKFIGTDPMLGLVVGLSIASSMLIAVTVGSFTPLILRKLEIDPAVATGPFVTTSIDILGVLFYFVIAGILLNI